MNESQAEMQALLEPAIRVLAHAPPADASSRLAALAEMVERWGARMNLTGHRTRDEVARALIGDAIGLLDAIERAAGAPLAGRVIDLGSGAGFPGLPIAILRPGAQVHMVEAREKRHYFQRAVCRTLGLENAHPVLSRIEEVPIDGGDWILAQAVGPIEDVIVAMVPFAREGGRLVVPGSDRLQEPAAPIPLSGRIQPYRSPLLDQPRRFWIGIRAQGALA